MTRKQRPSPRNEAFANGDDTFRLLFLRHPAPTWVYDAKTLHILEVNDAAVRQYGYSREEFLGMAITDIRCPDKEKREPGNVEGRSKKSKEAGNERHRLKDGREIDVHVISCAIAFGGRNATLLSAEDVTTYNRAIEALNEKQHLLSESQRIAHIGSWKCDATGRMSWSDEMHRICGVSPDTFTPNIESFLNLVHPDDRSLVQAWIDACLAGKKPGAFEFRTVATDGTVCIIRCLGSLEYDAESRAAYVAGTAQDITERKQFETRLRESERRFRRALENIPDVVVIYDRDRRIQYINNATRRVTGRSVSDYIGHRDEEVWPPEIYQAYLPTLLETFETRQTRSVETRLSMPKVGLRALQITCIPLLDEQGEIREVLGITHDFTERLQAEATLREAREREQQAVNAGNVGLWDWYLHSSRVYFSPEWKRQIGYADHEISDDISEWQNRIHPEDLGRCLQALEAFIANPGPRFDLEFRLRHKDGSYRQILSRGSLLCDERDQPIRLLGSNVDITERMELQTQFLQAQKMESVGRLAGGIAHDFNNLLTVINGAADMAMLELNEGDPLRADLEEIRNAGDRAALLTRQLLAFSRKQVLQPVVLNLNTVIADMQTLLRRLIGEDVGLAFAPAEDLGCVMADPGQIEQVLLNLVVNARDAMPRGGALTIATSNVEFDAAHAERHSTIVPGSYVMVSIRDTGIGMDEATQARAFEPFFTTKGSGKGTGLGLSTVYGIVKQSGGSIWVSSEVDKGTSFNIYLPRVEGTPDTTRPVRPATTIRGTETILIVEDENGLRNLAERMLKSAGYNVLIASSGEEALLLLKRFKGPVHLMFTDVVMPGISGWDLAGRLRAIRPEMKVLYSSGYTDYDILRHGVFEDANHFIGKPYTVLDLTRKVRDVLDRKE